MCLKYWLLHRRISLEKGGAISNIPDIAGNNKPGIRVILSHIKKIKTYFKRNHRNQGAVDQFLINSPAVSLSITLA